MFILRREREKTGFSFCLESEWAGGQKVDRSGNGLLQVWKRQIQQLNRVSPDMASAILSAYPSPQLLAQVKAVFKYEVPNRKILIVFASLLSADGLTTYWHIPFNIL